MVFKKYVHILLLQKKFNCLKMNRISQDQPMLKPNKTDLLYEFRLKQTQYQALCGLVLL